MLPMPDNLPEPVISANVKLALEKRLLRKNHKDKIRETRELLWRVASAVAGQEVA